MTDRPEAQWLRDKLRHIANETAELPVIRRLAEPLYARMFARPHQLGNTYRGVYASHAEARAAAPHALPSSYDVSPTAAMYRDRTDRILVSDYPAVYWLGRLFGEGARRVFDLGGHMGISFRGFREYLQYPADLTWQVHDVPAVVTAGREMVAARPELSALSFADRAEDADGCDVLVSFGALQYLDYTLPDLLAILRDKPAHVVVNLTPMHPREHFFTLQNIGKAVLPYRVSSIDGFTSEMDAAGYDVRDHWQSRERAMRIPFSPAHSIDSYAGFCFELRVRR